MHSKGMYDLWSRPEVCEHAGEAVDLHGNPIRLPAQSSEDSDKIIEFFRHAEQAGTGFRWAVIAKEEPTFVGAAGFNSLDECAEIAYHLHPAYWGAGLMSEACRAALSWITEVHGSDSIEAYVDPENAASIRLLQRLGFQAKGYFRDGAERYTFWKDPA